jgi:aminoglycoside phosphotransferase (APT) family kinase protein
LATASQLPVARPVVLCEDDGVVGAPFTVVEWVGGVVVRSQDDLAALSDDQVHRATAALVEVLVALHARLEARVPASSGTAVVHRADRVDDAILDRADPGRVRGGGLGPVDPR